MITQRSSISFLFLVYTYLPYHPIIVISSQLFSFGFLSSIPFLITFPTRLAIDFTYTLPFLFIPPQRILIFLILLFPSLSFHFFILVPSFTFSPSLPCFIFIYLTTPHAFLIKAFQFSSHLCLPLTLSPFSLSLPFY